jgi:hypothetical protein
MVVAAAAAVRLPLAPSIQGAAPSIRGPRFTIAGFVAAVVAVRFPFAPSFQGAAPSIPELSSIRCSAFSFSWWELMPANVLALALSSGPMSNSVVLVSFLIQVGRCFACRLRSHPLLPSPGRSNLHRAVCIVDPVVKAGDGRGNGPFSYTLTDVPRLGRIILGQR